jgi:cobalt/nickel transport system permease protein
MGNGPLHALDARVKLIGAVVFVAFVVATPVGAWRFLGAEGLVLAFLIGLSGVPLLELWRRWVVFFVLVGFVALMVAPAHPARASYGLGVVAATILIKNSMALFAILVLASVTPFPRLLGAMRRLGIPPVLVATLQFMDRYRHVLTNELARMATARRARTFDRRRALPWTMLSAVVGILFLKSFERAERVHGAMIARGWTGELHSLDV